MKNHDRNVSTDHPEHARVQDVEPSSAEPTRRGRKPLLSMDQREAVLQLLREPPALHGFSEGGWTRTRVQILLQRRFGVHLSLASISGLRAELTSPETAPDVAPITVPSDIGLFLVWARHTRDAVVWYDRTLRPLYANAVLLTAVQGTLETLRKTRLHERPAWTSVLPEGYVPAVQRVAASGISETLHLPVRNALAGDFTLSVLVQCDAESVVRSIATVLRSAGSAVD